MADLHSIERTRILSGEAVAVEEEVYDVNVPISFTTTQLIAGVWTTRVTGILTLVGSIFVIVRAWNRRKGLFHRLILGMGIHLTIFGAAYTYGAAAVPRNTTNAVGNYGTTATCTAQGFLIYVSFMTACWYYGSFSIYSYLGTLNNFQKSTDYGAWIGKYIHVLVHIYPVFTGIVLAGLGIFNNTGIGHCFLESDPIGCGGSPRVEEYVPCERGMETHPKNELIKLVWDAMLYLEMIVPTGIMIALYFKVKQNQSRIHIQARDVARQAVIYLLVLYLGIFPWAMFYVVENSVLMTISAVFNLSLFSAIMFTIFNLLSMLCYLYFSTDRSVTVYDDDNDGAYNEFTKQNTNIFGQLEKDETDNGHGHGTGSKEPPPDPNSECTISQSQSQSQSRGTSKKSYSFNIFDGTNASGGMAQFVFEGDSDDEREDKLEGEKWKAVQNHI